MSWGLIWLIWFVTLAALAVVSFAILERLSWNKGHTLSHTAATMPKYGVFILGWLNGGLTCGLCVHFWWWWAPT